MNAALVFTILAYFLKLVKQFLYAVTLQLVLVRTDYVLLHMMIIADCPFSWLVIKLVFELTYARLT